MKLLSNTISKLLLVAFFAGAALLSTTQVKANVIQACYLNDDCDSDDDCGAVVESIESDCYCNTFMKKCRERTEAMNSLSRN